MEERRIKEIEGYNSRVYFKLRNNDSELFYRRYKDERYFYDGACIDKLLTDPEYFQDILNQKFVYTDSPEDENEKVKISLDIVCKWKERKEKKRKVWLEKYGEIRKREQHSLDYIYIYRYFDKEEVEVFYRFDLEIGIKGISCPTPVFDSSIQLFYIPEPAIDPELHYLYDRIFGEPKRYSHSPDFRIRFYTFKTEEIDKIIATKSYYTIDSVFEKTLELNGKKEEFVLDMHSFDDNIYQLFNKHYLLEIEEVDVPIDEEDSEPVKSPWYKRLFGFQ